MAGALTPLRTLRSSTAPGDRDQGGHMPSRLPATRSAVALSAALLITAAPANAMPGRDSGRAATEPPGQIRIVQTAPDGFEWPDAGIGAGSAIAVVLLAAAAQATRSRRRTSPEPLQPMTGVTHQTGGGQR
jgi:hypothetical protein